MTFFGETGHFCGKIGALKWSILVEKQKHNVQKPIGWPWLSSLHCKSNGMYVWNQWARKTLSSNRLSIQTSKD